MPNSIDFCQSIFYILPNSKITLKRIAKDLDFLPKLQNLPNLVPHHVNVRLGICNFEFRNFFQILISVQISAHDSSSSQGDAFSPPTTSSNPRRSSSSSTTSSRPSLAEDIQAIRISLEGASSLAREKILKILERLTSRLAVAEAERDSALSKSSWDRRSNFHSRRMITSPLGPIQ